MTDKTSGRSGEKVGYARVSTPKQRSDSQVDDLKAAGCTKLFVDKGVTGKRADRPEFEKCLSYLRAGDTLVITRFSRAMRNIRHLLNVAHELDERGVALKVLHQEIDTSTPHGRLLFHVLAAVDEFQREIIVENTREGLETARARHGGKLPGRGPSLTLDKIETARKLYAEGSKSAQQIADIVGCSRATLYRHLTKL
jgi:DNA invertase Pin-like site-specific DNA recombinase